MPIILDDLSANNTQPATTNMYDPKFFHSDLTGSGKAKGVLSEENNPINIPADRQTMSTYVAAVKKSVTNGFVTTNVIPMNPLCKDAYTYLSEIKVPDIQRMAYLGENPVTHTKIYADINVHSITIEKTVTPGGYANPGSTKRTIMPCYQLTLFGIIHSNKTTANLVNDVVKFNDYLNTNVYYNMFTCNPISDMEDIIDYLTKYKLDISLFTGYLANISLYDLVCCRVESWLTTIDKDMEVFVKCLASKYVCTGRTNMPYTVSATLIQQVKYLMNYQIPLDLYKNIYSLLKSTFDADYLAEICKQNLNLLLSNTMNNLENNKQSLVSFNVPANITVPASFTKLSPEQKNAVSCTKPLILVQAGAGTGKSTLILSRIDYLIACGVKPEDITVLSFTNAAADHISEKNSQVHSMTIASMIHEIYTTNFPNHELSSLDTMVNSIDIYYPKTATNPRPQVVQDFQSELISIKKNDVNTFTEMNNFIEKHYKEVIDILNTLKQTTLELEIIICYQKIETFKEPASVQSKFLIIDEVQDNSIFEFVYTLKYVDKHKESLFIVGDCSQTLYEFRASNPRALNILEGSGTFDTFQLTVNYRSNQEILDFANVLLQNIEANQYANIQLQANSLAMVTEQSFLDKVNFNYYRMTKASEFKDMLAHVLSIEGKLYIDECLARGEQVTFLAYKRSDITEIKNNLAILYPTKKIINLIPDKASNVCVMTQFIKKYWNDIKFVPASNPNMTFTSMIYQMVMAKLEYMFSNADRIRPQAQIMLTKWMSSEQPTIDAWVKQMVNGQITHEEFMNLTKKNLIDFEITHNAIRASMLSQRNQAKKANEDINTADFLLSTIHSAKGLEFDNVFVLYRDKSDMPEDEKRMYYVALTRAMKTEYILAYNTIASPRIQADYNTVLEKLHAIAPAYNSPIVKKAKRPKI